MLKTENCEWQALMDVAYDRWVRHNDEIERALVAGDISPVEAREQSWGVHGMLVNACETEAERAACIFGKLNQQIGNGGVIQWMDNGYAAGCIEWLPDLLPETGPVGEKIWGLLSSILEDYMEDLDDNNLSDEDWEVCSVNCDRVSNAFYELEDAWHLEVYAYLAELLKAVPVD